MSGAQPDTRKGLIMALRLYEGLPTDVREAIDTGFNTFFRELRNESYGADNCDEAEKLIDAMVHYFIRSNPSFYSVTYANAAYYNTTGEYAKGCGPQ